MSELGVGLQGTLAPAALAEVAERIEEARFDVLSIFGDLGYGPPIPALVTAAARTRTLRLGPACVNPYTTHPVDIAAQIAYLDAASGGRAYLGLSRGAWLEQIGVEQPRPLAALRDGVEIVRRLLAGDVSGYAGRVFRIEPGFRLHQEGPRRAVPILLGGWGPRVLALAGEIADEIKLGGTANPAFVRWARSELERGRAKRPAGTADDLPRIVTGAVTVVDPDGTCARAVARTRVATYVDVVGALDPTGGVDPELLARLHELVVSERTEEAGRLLPDDVVDRFALAGTPEAVASRIEELHAAGAHRVELGPPLGVDGIGPALELVGRTVVKALR